MALTHRRHHQTETEKGGLPCCRWWWSLCSSPPERVQALARLNGTRRTYSIGEWGEGSNRVSLKHARDAHDVARAAVARGQHPIGKKFAAALTEIEKAGRKTVKKAAEGWKAHINKQSRSDKTRDRDERMIGYINGAFGHLYVEDLKAPHLVALLNTFETAGSYETRSRLQSTAINIMGWAHGQAWIEHNPFVGFSFGKAFTPATNVARPAIRAQALRPAPARHHCLSGASRQPCRQGAPIARAHLRAPERAAAGRMGRVRSGQGALDDPFQEAQATQFPRGHQGADRQTALRSAVTAGGNARA